MQASLQRIRMVLGDGHSFTDTEIATAVLPHLRNMYNYPAVMARQQGVLWGITDAADQAIRQVLRIPPAAAHAVRPMIKHVVSTVSSDREAGLSDVEDISE